MLDLSQTEARVRRKHDRLPPRLTPKLPTSVAAINRPQNRQTVVPSTRKIGRSQVRGGLCKKSNARTAAARPSGVKVNTTR